MKSIIWRLGVHLNTHKELVNQFDFPRAGFAKEFELVIKKTGSEAKLEGIDVHIIVHLNSKESIFLHDVMYVSRLKKNLVSICFGR